MLEVKPNIENTLIGKTVYQYGSGWYVYNEKLQKIYSSLNISEYKRLLEKYNYGKY